MWRWHRRLRWFWRSKCRRRQQRWLWWLRRPGLLAMMQLIDEGAIGGWLGAIWIEGGMESTRRPQQKLRDDS